MSSHPVRAWLARLVSDSYPRLRGFSGHREFQHLLQLDRGDAAAIRRWHQARLAERLPWWHANIPFYREHLDRVAAGQGRTVAELIREMVDACSLHHLPLLDKDAIRLAGDTLHVAGHDPATTRANHTGGSTGEVLHFLQNAEDSRWMVAGMRLFRSYMGLDNGARLAQIWGSPIGLSRSRSARARLGRWLLHSDFHSTYDLTAERRREIVAAIHRFLLASELA